MSHRSPGRSLGPPSSLLLLLLPLLLPLLLQPSWAAAAAHPRHAGEQNGLPGTGVAIP